MKSIENRDDWNYVVLQDPFQQAFYKDQVPTINKFIVDYGHYKNYYYS